MAKNFEEEKQYEVLTHFSARISTRAVLRASIRAARPHWRQHGARCGRSQQHEQREQLQLDTSHDDRPAALEKYEALREDSEPDRHARCLRTWAAATHWPRFLNPEHALSN